MTSDPGTVPDALGLRLEAELRTIIDAIPQLMVAVGADGNFLYVSGEPSL